MVCKKWNVYLLILAIQTGATTIEIMLMFLKKLKIDLSKDQAISLLTIYQIILHNC